MVPVKNKQMCISACVRKHVKHVCGVMYVCVHVCVMCVWCVRLCMCMLGVCPYVCMYVYVRFVYIVSVCVYMCT